MHDNALPRIGVFGAGSVGCYLGGRLAHAGATVTLAGRARIGDVLQAHGLHLTDHRGNELRVASSRFAFHTDARALADADLVLVTVKSAGTDEAGSSLAGVLRDGTPVISFQNGLRNAAALRAALPAQRVFAGVVGFNVVNRGGGHFHQGTDGRLDVPGDESLQRFAPLFARAGLPLATHADLAALQWAKLQLNLNNAINALSDLPLREQLSRRSYRRCLALAQRELLRALDTAGLRIARLTPLPPRWMPALLELPDALFRIVARRTLAIDPLARSSMWEDLQAGRPSEVDVLNGEVVALALAHGCSAAGNARLVELVHDAERGGRRHWSGEDLLASLQAAETTARVRHRS